MFILFDFLQISENSLDFISLLSILMTEISIFKQNHH
jgi:hypothetical protein